MTVRMARTRWLKYSQILLVGSALTTGPVFVSAFAANGNAQPDVEVNWGLLDRLGQESTLPQLLLRDEGKDTMAVQPGPSPSVQFRPYRSGDGSGAKEASPPKASPAPSRSPAPASGGPVYRSYEPKAQPKAKPESTSAPKPSVTPPPVSKPAPVEKPVPAEKVEKAAPLPVIPPTPPKVETPRPVEPPQAVVPAPVVTPTVEPPKTEVPKATLPPVAVPKVEAPKAVPPKVEPSATLPSVTPPKTDVPSVAPPEPDVNIPAPMAPVPTPPTPMPSAPAVHEPVVTPTPAAPPLSSVPSSSAARIEGNTLIVAFAADEAAILEAAKPLLNELAERLSKDEGLSIQFLAYAGGDEAQASKARRLSLTRALTVRQFFLDRGVRSTRMEVRAMGNRGATNRSPVDRVEIVVVSR